MAQTKIFINDTMNYSLQPGDIAYVADVNGDFTTEPIKVGEILDVQSSYIIIDKDIAASPVITSGMFLLFSKRTEVNNPGLKGYYADITFQNYSNSAVELYAIGSEISPSSK